MATILEALQNAKHNIGVKKPAIQIAIGIEQLNNAVTLLEKGYSLNDDVEEIMENFDNAEDVPEKVNYDAVEPFEKEGD